MCPRGRVTARSPAVLVLRATVSRWSSAVLSRLTAVFRRSDALFRANLALSERNIGLQSRNALAKRVRSTLLARFTAVLERCIWMFWQSTTALAPVPVSSRRNTQLHRRGTRSSL